jgi:hypothetical protein
VSADSGTDAARDIHSLAARADTLMRLGVAEKGASRSFEEATALLDEAEKRLANADLPPAVEEELRLESATVREDLTDLMALYEERFYGVFPLARLTVPTLLADEGLVIAEQLFHPPDVAGVIIATRKVAGLVDEYHHPHVVFRSSPENRRLENIAAEELLRDGRSMPYTRKTLVSALGPAELAAFDRGELDTEILDRLTTALNTVSLLVLTIGEFVELEDAHVLTMHGEYVQPGEVIQGSATEASPFLTVDTFSLVGSARDRRGQYWPIFITQLVLFGLALIWSTRVRWSLGRPLRVFGRLVVGAALFAFGRVFAILVILGLRRVIPDASAMAAAAWWWPASLGLLVVLGGGLLAWIGQARMADIVPGTRGVRAVGTLFALVALGACSHFVTPLLIFDPATGWLSLFPFLVSALSLALVFAFAARTGPPVPHYFLVGPALLAPLLGMALMTASPGLLWATAAASALLCLAASVRHRIAVARGTEEPEPDPDEAARIDHEKLRKLRDKIPGKL